MVDIAPVRLSFAFSLGAATFFAPCAIPLLPGYVAYYVGRDDGGLDPATPLPGRLRRAAVVGVLASLGFFLVYGGLAGVAVALGTRYLQHVSVLELVVGVLLVALGTVMASGKLSPAAFHVALPERRRTPTGFVAFGVVYAAAAAGCTAPAFVAVASLGLTSGPVAALATLGAYAAGMSVLMVTVTLLTALGRGALVSRLSAHSGKITRVAGGVLVVAGLVQLYFWLFRFDGIELLLFEAVA